MIRILSLALILYAALVACPGQDRSVDGLKAKANGVAPEGIVRVSYNEYVDEIGIMSLRVLDGPFEGIDGVSLGRVPYSVSTGIEFFAKGKVMPPVDKFTWVFRAHGPDWTFLKGGTTLAVIAGDELIEFQLSTPSVRRKAAEYLTYEITRKQIEKIVSVPNAHFSLGPTKPQKLHPDLLRGWQAMLQITK
jgi:hypothetical protein